MLIDKKGKEAGLLSCLFTVIFELYLNITKITNVYFSINITIVLEELNEKLDKIE